MSGVDDRYKHATPTVPRGPVRSYRHHDDFDDEATPAHGSHVRASSERPKRKIIKRSRPQTAE
jgi:hypothetical protein